MSLNDDLRNEKSREIHRGPSIEESRKYFTSPIMSQYAESFTRSVLSYVLDAQKSQETDNRYRSIFFQPYRTDINTKLDYNTNRPDITAYTDGHSIYVNAAHELVAEEPSLRGQFEAAFGFLSHELGHVLFTDCQGRTEYLEKLMKRNEFPFPSVKDPLLESKSFQEKC